MSETQETTIEIDSSKLNCPVQPVDTSQYLQVADVLVDDGTWRPGTINAHEAELNLIKYISPNLLNPNNKRLDIS